MVWGFRKKRKRTEDKKFHRQQEEIETHKPAAYGEVEKSGRGPCKAS